MERNNLCFTTITQLQHFHVGVTENWISFHQTTANMSHGQRLSVYQECGDGELYGRV